MLRLALDTDPAWGEFASRHLEEVLLDHAHCEKKAASAALTLLFRYPQHASLQAPLSALAREELGHFEAVLAALGRRGVPFGRQRPSPYAGKLHAVVRATEPERLLDLLLCCAAIEARSCERLTLLRDAVGEPELRSLYGSLLAAEARHHRLYADLAAQIFPEPTVRDRLREILAHEAQVVAESPANLARLHAGPLK
ncbi:MAG TPA: tRNA-(ms[2]io[6]A)-hydroxylase [Myxococcota bacterium]|nr:tRNA-(ms[2]io[6]A)-hydroxylase [Myxococcota bacterium]